MPTKAHFAAWIERNLHLRKDRLDICNNYRGSNDFYSLLTWEASLTADNRFDPRLIEPVPPSPHHPHLTNSSFPVGKLRSLFVN